MQDERSEVRHSNSGNFVRDIVLPLSQVFVLVWALLSPASPWRWLLIIAAIIIVINEQWPRLSRYVRKRRTRSSDEQFARQEFPRFRQFVHRFGDFASKQHNDTLHHIVARELSQTPREAVLMHYQATPIEHWNNLWELFDQRVRRQSPMFGELVPLIQEFNSLIGSYHTYCVAPIFNRLGDDVRAKMSGSDKRKLAAFQQRYHSFTTDYTEFLRLLSESHPKLEHLPRYLPIPEPL